ncbi:hypothetical protein BJN45_05685 [Azonexus hydrophilus]|uniref:Replication initiation factor n=1 Tax=Azonexus hydrophilus TaxID=418702 RepID=A0A1R1I7J1_9RHOO|nr:hypothetical protein [Azonexus hydrophilus]OMG54701.1 hypothetical protein BJN45_05685 [Azonexus hydrophilus]
MNVQFLLFGHDTIECAYYLAALSDCSLDFTRLTVEKESLRLAKIRHPKAIKLGSETFLLASHGTGSGYPFLIENDAFSIQFGEFNKPNFFVTYRSFALWQYGASALHRRFLDWAASVGYTTFMPEHLSRVDFTFDYQIPAIDFNEDNFVSATTKDKQFRKNRKVQTFGFGEGDVVLRVYNKVDEIQEKSAKTWFFDLWQCSENVWRIEWQIRKAWLRTFGIQTFADLEERQGDLLRVLVHDHTTLRIQTDDSNRSRWPVHPVWADLQERVRQMAGLGVVRELDTLALLEERETRMAISVYGYLKRLGAIHGIKRKTPEIGFDESFALLRKKLDRIHDDLTWETDVRRRYDEMRLGQW